tara:strand:- start:682 stop:1089 length:408 start_codon:yes stop_codon:yes gene_type:complete
MCNEKTNFNKIQEFHDVFGGIPADMDEKLVLRERLIAEECAETMEALSDVRANNTAENRAEFLKELVDLLYVTYGTIHTMGWDADAAFEQVHASNMSKVDETGKPQYREDGKILKGPNYKKPDMKELVNEASKIA